MDEQTGKAVIHEIDKQLQGVLNAMRLLKPNDRSSLDRHCAVVITDLEKVNAYFTYYFAQNIEFVSETS